MEFGRTQLQELAAIDFSLPKDSLLTNDTLAKTSGDNGFMLHVGCSRWGHKGWLGMLYPPNARDRDFLSEYVKHFNTVEFSATFYNIPETEQVLKWLNQSRGRRDFRYCLKFPQTITHIRRLKNAEDQTKRFYDAVKAFGDQAGATFLQLGEKFTPKSFDDLKKYISMLPKDVPVFVEARNKDWFGQTVERGRLFNMLAEYGTGAVITDAPGRRDGVHMELPVADTMIRFVGNDLDQTDFSRIDAWAERLQDWKARGLKSVWFTVHSHDERYAPELVDYAIKLFNSKLGTDLKGPNLRLRFRGPSDYPGRTLF